MKETAAARAARAASNLERENLAFRLSSSALCRGEDGLSNAPASALASYLAADLVRRNGGSVADARRDCLQALARAGAAYYSNGYGVKAEERTAEAYALALFYLQPPTA